MHSLTERRRIRRVQVIFKIAERCNLACSYCYYFEGGDQSYKEKPAVVSFDTARELAKFLSRGVDDLALDEVWIAFHGGEPFMVKPTLFDQICGVIRDELESKCRLILGAQTNGTHVNDKLLEVINRHRVEVSVSIDGTQQAHDRERKDHRGRGSYERVKQNYLRLAENSKQQSLAPVEIISVLDARNDYREMVTGLNQELGVEHFNFLLPDCNHDDGIPGGFSARDYGRTLCEIFDCWAESDTLAVREIDNFLQRFQLAVESERESLNRTTDSVRYKENQVIVVRSDGELQIDDTYIPASNWRNQLLRINLRDTNLANYLASEVFDEIEEIFANPPEACQKCVWENVCNGGDLENRYSIKNGFDNPSVYCEGLRMFYRRVALFLRRNGYPAKVMRDRLRNGADRHEFRYAK